MGRQNENCSLENNQNRILEFFCQNMEKMKKRFIIRLSVVYVCTDA